MFFQQPLIKPAIFIKPKLYLKTYNHEIVSFPKRDIAVVEGYNYNQQVNLIVNDDPEAKDVKIKIMSVDGIEYFKSQGRYFMYDADGKPLFNINQTNKIIYRGEDDSRILAKIESLGLKNNIKKYTITFHNLASEKEETIYMCCDKYYCSCGIFHGNDEKGDSPLIGRVVELMDANSFIANAETRYSLDIAPNVDNVLIIALAVFFINKSQINRDRRFH